MDFAPNYTPRYIFSYSTAGQGHKFQVRVPRGAERADSGVTSKIESFINALAPLRLPAWTLTDCIYIPEDEFISLPVDISLVNVEIGEAVVSGSTNAFKARETRFQCKSNVGTRNSLSIYSLILGIPEQGGADDYRITGAENADIAAAITVLNEVSPMFVPPGGVTSVWKNYVNIKPNNYWVNQLRG